MHHLVMHLYNLQKCNARLDRTRPHTVLIGWGVCFQCLVMLCLVRMWCKRQVGIYITLNGCVHPWRGQTDKEVKQLKDKDLKKYQRTTWRASFSLPPHYICSSSCISVTSDFSPWFISRVCRHHWFLAAVSTQLNLKVCVKNPTEKLFEPPNYIISTSASHKFKLRF